MIGIALGLALAVPQAPSPAQTRARVEGQAPARATLADMAWIVGSWHGTRDGGTAAETYSPAEGGQITGHFYETKNGAVTLMELIQIIERDGSLACRLRHFNRDMTGWEDATRTPVEFPLIAIEGKRMYFDGITLDHSRANGMDFWVRITRGGTAREIVYRYDRVR